MEFHRIRFRQGRAYWPHPERTRHQKALTSISQANISSCGVLVCLLWDGK
jgi:hypothetical protein